MAESCTKASVIPTVKLSSGYDMPIFGLGTWQIKPEEIDTAITVALNNGYNHIDTAFEYENEEAIGKSLKKWFDKGGKREDLFITSKLPPYGNRASDVELYLKDCLKKLGLEYIDLYLLHAPFAVVRDKNNLQPAIDRRGKVMLDNKADILETWKVMEAQVKAGRTKSIGISNFKESQIVNLLKSAEIKPCNLQIELHAYSQQKPLCDFCAKHAIVVTSYSSLGSPGTVDFEKTERGKSMPKLLDHPVVQKIAEKYKKSTAHVLLRHLVQHRIIVIPKSTNPERIKSNINIFDFKLTDDEMKQMDNLDMGENGRIFDYTEFEGWWG